MGLLLILVVVGPIAATQYGKQIGNRAKSSGSGSRAVAIVLVAILIWAVTLIFQPFQSYGTIIYSLILGSMIGVLIYILGDELSSKNLGISEC